MFVAVMLMLVAPSATPAEEYPELPTPWEYLGYMYDRNPDGSSEQSNFFLERLEIYPDCPGSEILNTGHHVATHVAVQYRQDGEWHWRPALYADEESIPELDLFSACYLLADPDTPGAYFLAYQRSGPFGTHLLFYMTPREASGPDEQPYDANVLLTGRDELGEPGDSICSGTWGLPVPFTRQEKPCLLVLVNDRFNEAPGLCSSTHAIIQSLEAGESWGTIPRNRYQHVWIESGRDWVPLRWNALEILGGDPLPDLPSATQVGAVVFQYEDATYLLTAGGATKNSWNWANSTSRGFLTLYRFLDGSPPGADMDYRVELVEALVDPVGAMPGSPAMTGGFVPTWIHPVQSAGAPGAVPSFLACLSRRPADDLERWVHDFGDGPEPVSGGFVILQGGEGVQGPTFTLEPPRPGDRDYEMGYPAGPWPGVDGEKVIFKSSWEGRNLTLAVPKLGGVFDLNNALTLFDQNKVVSSDEWEMHFFQAAFIGTFPHLARDDWDLVLPFSIVSKADSTYVRHTYITWNELATALDESGGGGINSAASCSPNPSCGEVRICFSLRRAGEVRLQVYDIAGRRLRTLRRDHLGRGPQSIEWDGRDRGHRELPAGVYFYRLATEIGEATGRLILLR
ncbi:MAG: T9SS type A sorting domain-containing protein [Candidatus Eisenbacteria sp.]|nr:T9SS type A sorting domain-containing protein [Candidatus Eisenbacteria bacterium]